MRPAGSQSQPDQHGRTNTLGINQRTLEEVVKRLGTATPASGKAQRGFVRWPFPQAAIELRLDHPGGTATTMKVACRNISCGGVGLLHRSFVHPGTRAHVRLPHSRKGFIDIPGVVVRCLHRAGVVHELGLCFEKPIDMQQVVDADPFEECFSVENVKPEDLSGNILYVEDSAMDARLVKHFTRMTKLSLSVATNGTEALDAASKGVKVILMDFHLPDCEAPQLVAQLRESHVFAPIIAVTADASRGTKERLRAAGIDAFLAKPLTEDRVLRAIAEFILRERWASADTDSHLDTESREFLAKAFIEELQQITPALEKAIQNNASMDVYAMVGRIGNSAQTLGFADLAKKSRAAAAVLSMTMACADSTQELGEFLTVCHRYLKSA
jgi:CheY-like chemotaxis protein